MKISNKKLDISKTIGYKNGKQTLFINENIEYAVEIINHQNTLCKVDQIEMPFKKSENKKGYLLIDFYENNNGEVGELLNYKNYTVRINTITKNTILTIEDLIFLKQNESIYIAMTWVDNINAKSEIYSNVLTFFSLPKGSSGKMYARRTYNDWHHSPLIENETTISSFIPAFRIHAKCEK